MKGENVSMRDYLSSRGCNRPVALVAVYKSRFTLPKPVMTPTKSYSTFESAFFTRKNLIPSYTYLHDTAGTGRNNNEMKPSTVTR